MDVFDIGNGRFSLRSQHPNQGQHILWLPLPKVADRDHAPLADIDSGQLVDGVNEAPYAGGVLILDKFRGLVLLTMSNISNWGVSASWTFLIKSPDSTGPSSTERLNSNLWFDLHFVHHRQPGTGKSFIADHLGANFMSEFSNNGDGITTNFQQELVEINGQHVLSFGENTPLKIGVAVQDRNGRIQHVDLLLIKKVHEALTP
ncbi:hypothetical protein BC939DRAFT_526104 [Gamsiella multidivaricata]|uniref:uncharacterized protein n=1 Tax=Gamsiella multidivaricata TaxID=101098 RepID=UPI00221F3E2C|nr:uncharacterized protein BC939DRAFT_526104 [Gamsiella multidivaricata]KAI7829598.1 hypothetical protein BC939DRAFT_526104 [Gamsiella multidivaricata]